MQTPWGSRSFSAAVMRGFFTPFPAAPPFALPALGCLRPPSEDCRIDSQWAALTEGVPAVTPCHPQSLLIASFASHRRCNRLAPTTPYDLRAGPAISTAQIHSPFSQYAHTDCMASNVKPDSSLTPFETHICRTSPPCPCGGLGLIAFPPNPTIKGPTAPAAKAMGQLGPLCLWPAWLLGPLACCSTLGPCLGLGGLTPPSSRPCCTAATCVGLKMPCSLSRVATPRPHAPAACARLKTPCCPSQK